MCEKYINLALVSVYDLLAECLNTSFTINFLALSNPTCLLRVPQNQNCKNMQKQPKNIQKFIQTTQITIVIYR